MVQTQAETDRGLARRREILLEASKAFREKGFHSTGMRDIAARLGMTVGNLYYYFRNKEDLLAFCQEETLRRLEELLAALPRVGERADARLFHLVTGHVVCLNTGAQGSLAHLEVPDLEEGDRRDLLARRDAYERALRELVRDGVRSGVFRDVDPKVTALAILGAVNWTVRWFRPDGRRSAKSIGAAFAEHLVSGLLADGVSLERSDIDIRKDT